MKDLELSVCTISFAAWWLPEGVRRICDHICPYMAIYGNTLLYMAIDLAGVISFAPSSVIVALQLPMLEFSAPTPPLLTICLKLVLWKCSYGLWDYVMLSVNSYILLFFTSRTWIRGPRPGDPGPGPSWEICDGDSRVLSQKSVFYFIDGHHEQYTGI